MNRLTLTLLAAFLTIALTDARAAEKPLKVYILVGQSNMQGHAQVRTFEHLAMSPRSAEMLKDLQSADGTPRVCEHVWISSIGNDGTENEKHGQLTVGYGAAGGSEPKIGPELTFGIHMQKLAGQPILLIKTAWGGKSINTDFRPPSAGPYEFNEQQLENFRKQNVDIEAARQQKAEATGHYYRLMLAHVRKVLSDPGRVCPDYNERAGYELAGFVWFQGWNDMVDQGTYPARAEPGGYDQYSEVLADFIRDVRKDLKAPELPFVIGVLGVGGPVEKYGPDQQRYSSVHSEFRKAMAAPALMPEFKGNVAAVLTENYWDPQLSELAARWGKVQGRSRELSRNQDLSREEREQQLDAFKAELFTAEELDIYQKGTSNAAYHYLGSAWILGQIGQAFAEAIHEL
jgi:hypothetical protein